MSYFANVTFTPTPAAQDAFGRLRVAENYTIFDSKLLYDTQSLFWDYTGSLALSSSVYYDNTRAAAILSVTGACEMHRQTRMRFNYQPGKSQLIFMTGDMVPEKGVLKRIGYYESQFGGIGAPHNGIYFERSGSDLYACVASSGSIVSRVSQSNWNIDTLTTGNSLNPSGYNLDPRMVQIHAFDFEWLGVGNIRWAYVFDGKIVPVHQYSAGNKLNSVTFLNPNLPCRYTVKIVSGSATQTGSIQTICAAVQTEGGFQYNGIPRNITTPAAVSCTSPNNVPLLVIRQRSGLNLSTILMKNIQTTAASTTNADLIQIQLTLNPVFSIQPVFTSSLNSTLEYNLGTVGGTVSGGTVMRVDTCGGTNANTDVDLSDTPLRLGANIGGISDILCVSGTSLQNTRTIIAALNFTEIL